MLEQDPENFSWIIDKESDEKWRDWWNKVVKNKSQSDRKGKTLSTWRQMDYQNLKQGIYNQWVMVETKDNSSGEKRPGKNVSLLYF
jgi:hypothetical protein